MARMQKKKPAEKKKKKPAGGSDSNNARADKGSLAGAAAGGSAGAEVKQKKKPSYSGAGRTGAEQTFIVRLLERYFGNWIQFLREVKVELSKVTWPSRKETVGTTAVVLVFVIIIAIFLGLADYVLSSLVQLIL